MRLLQRGVVTSLGGRRTCLRIQFYGCTHHAFFKYSLTPAIAILSGDGGLLPGDFAPGDFGLYFIRLMAWPTWPSV